MLARMSTPRWAARALLWGGLLAAFCLTSSARPAHACRCKQGALPDALAGATAVFEGLVTSVDKVQGAEGAPASLDAHFKVVSVWKGSDNAEQVSVRTALSSAACGVKFEPGVSYLVFAHGEDDALQVTSCSRTRRTSEAAEDLAALGAGVTPVSMEDIKAAEVAASKAEESSSTPLPDTTKGQAGCASCSAGPAGLPSSASLLYAGLLWWAARRKR